MSDLRKEIEEIVQRNIEDVDDDGIYVELETLIRRREIEAYERGKVDGKLERR